MIKTHPDSGASVAPAATPSIDEAIVAKAEEIVDARIRKALEENESSQLSNAKTKEALLKVLQAALFESGLLEKIVHRAVDQRLNGTREGEAAAKGGVEAEGFPAMKDYLAKNLPELCKGEIQGIVQKQIQAAFAGENVKMLFDEKFRAISIYLKTEVIPKAISQQLRSGAK